jgi:hypothetical protein
MNSSRTEALQVQGVIRSAAEVRHKREKVRRRKKSTSKASMTQSELRKLSREDLLELLIEEAEETDKVRKENRALKERIRQLTESEDLQAAPSRNAFSWDTIEKENGLAEKRQHQDKTIIE